MKLLDLSYSFAPSTTPNAKRPFYFVKGFLEADWEVDVVSSFKLFPDGCSESLEHPRLTVQRLQDPLDMIENKLPNNRFGKIIFALVRSVLWPDTTVLWALRVALTVDTSKYDRVLVHISPPSMTLLGWIKRVDARWVYDYQDTASPSHPGIRRSPVYRWLMPLYARLQRIVLKKTDHVIFATKSYVQDYIQHGLVEKSKAIHIPFFYDNTAFPDTHSKPGKFTISYFGKFQKHEGGRSPEIFLRSLGLFLSRNPQARDSTEFRFFGTWIEEHCADVSCAGVQDVVMTHPAVPYDRYIELLLDSTVLLLIACKADNLFVPSKMLDYFGAHRPVFGFVPLDSETYSILKEAKMEQYVSDEMDVEGGARNLEKLWQSWREERPACSFTGAEKWSASVQVPRVVQLLAGGISDQV